MTVAPARRPFARGPITLSPFSRSPFARRSVLPLALTATLAATLIGCGSGGDSAGDGPCANVVSADSADARPITVPAATVTLSAPGSGDTAVAAVTPDRSSAQQVTLTTSSTEETLVSPDPESAVPPASAQDVTLPLTARANCTGDDVRAEYSIADPAAGQSELQGVIGQMNGTTGSLAFAAGLLPTRLIILPPGESGSQARQAVEQSLIQATARWLPLPTEAIGVGARWQSVRRVDGAVTVTQTIEAELAARDGDVLTIDYTIREEPVDDVFRIPGTDGSLTISRFAMRGSGTVTIDLRRLFPVAGELTMLGGRELVGDDPGAVIIQQNGFTATWTS